MRRLKRSECAVLPLVLKGKWYDMIERWEKREEYRDATPYWAIRLCNWDNAGGKCVVEFRRGYGRNAPRMAFTSPAFFNFCHSRHPEWGEPSRLHYAIILDERVELVGDRKRPTERPRQNKDERTVKA